MRAHPLGLRTGDRELLKNAALTREGRVQEGRIDAYPELLRLIEHRSLWFELRYRRLELVGDLYTKHPALPPEPQVGELATISALLAAFGSKRLKHVCSCWLTAVREYDRLNEIAQWNWQENYTGPDTPTNPEDLRNLRTQMVNVATERTRVELVIADEIRGIQLGEP